MTQTMVETPAVVPEIPSLAQGEATASPRPDPSRNSTSDSAAAPTAPAMTAPQETAPPSIVFVMARKCAPYVARNAGAIHTCV